jgi:hypothetical protein
MKYLTFLPLACAASLVVALPAQARDDLGRNVIIGGIAGAVIGENNHHHAAEGAVIGATAGLLLTAITDNGGHDRRSERHYYSAPTCRTEVIVSRPYCPPAPRMVVIQPANYRHYSREGSVGTYAHERYDRRDARYDDRRGDRRNDHREARHDDRRDDRRGDRRDSHEDRRDNRSGDHNRGHERDR